MSSSSSSSSGGSGSDASVDEEQKAGPGAAFKSYVILGDSISDRGGSGPFFYDLLADDLKGKLGDVEVVKNSKSGAVSVQLPVQAKGLPETLRGPVAVSVTIGGNDMQRSALEILNGKDEKPRTAFAENLVKAYDELTREGRFGAGVKVTVFHATIYDSDRRRRELRRGGMPGIPGGARRSSRRRLTGTTGTRRPRTRSRSTATPSSPSTCARSSRATASGS